MTAIEGQSGDLRRAAPEGAGGPKRGAADDDPQPSRHFSLVTVPVTGQLQLRVVVTPGVHT